MFALRDKRKTKNDFNILEKSPPPLDEGGNSLGIWVTRGKLGEALGNPGETGGNSGELGATYGNGKSLGQRLR